MVKDNYMVIQALPEMLAKKTAWIVFKEGIEKLLKEQPHVVIAVPGGRSVVPVFEELATFDIEWNRVHFFMADERFVPVKDVQSNNRLLLDQFGESLPDGSRHPFVFDEVNPHDSVKRYSQELDNLGGRFDIVLVSSGEDGHIASLFPGDVGVHPKGDNFIIIDDAPKPPSRRMSASIELLKSATVGILLIIGEGKQQVLDHFFDESKGVKSCPAKVIADLPYYFVLTDRSVSLPL
jgi:6-phosphogluconolactonase